MNPKPFKQAEILLVEDSRADVLIAQEAFAEFQVIDTFHVVEDGVQALAYLHQDDPYASAPRPDLLLLDLNLPRKNGREVLTEIKADPDLRTIPVIILTTSHAEQDVLQSYDMHANCYIVKPFGFKNYLETMKLIRQFWFTVATLPSEVNHE
jgi:CheY-like chemotaxis protein